MRWLIHRAGVLVTVRASTSAAEYLVESALANLRTRPAAQDRGVVLIVSSDEKGWKITDPVSAIKVDSLDAGDLIYHLTDRIIHHIAAQAINHHCLHAAAAGCEGRAVVMPAVSGSGKSSLALWLVSQGLEYITDEMTLVDDSRGVDGIARPIQIKTAGLPVLDSMIDSLEGIHKGKAANAVPVSCVGGLVSKYERHDFGLFLFPQFKLGSRFSFSRLTPAAAGMKLMSTHINARNLKGHGFSAAMELIRTSPCYALEYGGFDCLPVDFADQLRRLLIRL